MLVKIFHQEKQHCIHVLERKLIELVVVCWAFFVLLHLLWTTLESKIIAGVFSKDPWASFTNKSGIWFLYSRCNLDQSLWSWSFKDTSLLCDSPWNVSEQTSNEPPKLNELLWKNWHFATPYHLKPLGKRLTVLSNAQVHLWVKMRLVCVGMLLY